MRKGTSGKDTLKFIQSSLCGGLMKIFTWYPTRYVRGRMREDRSLDLCLRKADRRLLCRLSGPQLLATIQTL